jgi:glucuronosyltransferase
VVGPIQPTPAQPLPSDLDSFFTGAGDAGVVYVSFGTYEGLGHGELLASLASALGSLPCRVLWKLGPADFGTCLTIVFGFVFCGVFFVCALPVEGNTR